MFTTENAIHQLSTVAAGAAGQTTITSAAVDIAGFQGVAFIIPFGPLAGGASASIRLQGSNRADMADAVDLSGWNPADRSRVASAQTVADDEDNTVRFVDVKMPVYRFHRVIVERADADVTVGAIMAILYQARGNPFPQGLNVSGVSVLTPLGV